MREDLTGRTFGRWRVLSKSATKLYANHIAYICRCNCGTERLVSGSLLKRHKSQSCGCAFVEGAAKSQLKHGLTTHRLKGTWRSMKERCCNPNHAAYARYGGRGIGVCERWMSLETFIKDNEPLARPGLTLDRINNDAGYSPDNCRWVEPREQMRNRATTVWIEHQGRRQTMTDWAAELGITLHALRHRLDNWPLDEALTRPVTPPHRRNSR